MLSKTGRMFGNNNKTPGKTKQMPGMFPSHLVEFQPERVKFLRTFVETLITGVKLLRTFVETLLTFAKLLRAFVESIKTPVENKKTFAQFLRELVLFYQTVFFIKKSIIVNEVILYKSLEIENKIKTYLLIYLLYF